MHDAYHTTCTRLEASISRDEEIVLEISHKKSMIKKQKSLCNIMCIIYIYIINVYFLRSLDNQILYITQIGE